MAYTILITFTCSYLLANIVRGESSNMSNPLDQVPYVQIDSEGVFKYNLMKVSLDGDPDGYGYSKLIVRGKKDAKHHAELYKEECDKLHKLGLICKCLGGGRIKHNPAYKNLLVYGYSKAFGQANHQCTCDVLRKVYKTYTISFSNDGY